MRFIITVVVLWLTAAGAIAEAPYPSRPVKLLCWSSPGSPLDVMMRQLGKQFSEQFGQTFVVDNRPGGEGGIAMAAMLSQPADGYTILSTTSSMSFAMAMPNARFTPDQFTVLPALQAEPSAVAVKADSRFKTLRDFLAAMREHPDQISVGGFSSAGFNQYVYYRMEQLADFKSIWVPFKGGQDATMALLGGHIETAILTPSSALAQFQNGDIRLLAVSSAERNEYLPQVPTFREQGLDIVEAIWRGIMVRKGTPEPIVEALVSTIVKIKQTQEWRDFSTRNMQSSVTISREGMQSQVREEVAAYRAFLQAVGAGK